MAHRARHENPQAHGAPKRPVRGRQSTTPASKRYSTTHGSAIPKERVRKGGNAGTCGTGRREGGGHRVLAGARRIHHRLKQRKGADLERAPPRKGEGRAEAGKGAHRAQEAARNKPDHRRTCERSERPAPRGPRIPGKGQEAQSHRSRDRAAKGKAGAAATDTPTQSPSRRTRTNKGQASRGRQT